MAAHSQGFFSKWELTCTQTGGRATRQYVAHSAHALGLRGTGVHIKLIRPAPEIMACCRAGASAQSLGRLPVSDGRKEVNERGGRAPVIYSSNQVGLFSLDRQAVAFVSLPGRLVSFGVVI